MFFEKLCAYFQDIGHHTGAPGKLFPACWSFSGIRFPRGEKQPVFNDVHSGKLHFAWV